MPLVYRLITLLRRLPTTTTELKPGAKATVDAQRNGQSKSSGKSADDRDISNLGELETDGLRSEATSCCRSLVAHLSANRHWILAIQALELTISQLARSSFVVSVDVEESVESLSLLRQRLSSGGVSEHELEALFGTHETANPLDIQSLAGKSLVRSLQQQRGIDTVFIFSAMIMTPPVKAYQYLSTAMSHSGLLPSRVITLANIGAACSLVWQQQALLDRCRSVAAAARWSEQLQLLHIKFDVALLNDPKPQMLETLIRPMLAKTSMDITTVLEFAEEFRLDEAFVILEYISLCCSMPGIDGYQARILGIADEVANTKLLERTYADAMENGISAYDYEHLQFVVQRLHELRPQDEAVANYMATLDILCSYDRHCKPEAEELALEWTRTRAARETLQQFAGAGDSAEQDTGHTPPISVLVAQYPLATKRLPFHSLVNSDPWAVLLPELGVDTIDLLVALAKPLGLNQDDFYMNLIDSMLKQWKCSSPPELTREMAFAVATSKTPTHFNAIQPLIRCFKDPEAAVSTLKHVADELPCGPDRLAALKMGIKFLKKWAQYIRRMSEPERSEVLVKAETIYSHFEKSYADALVEVALRKHGLEQYLRLFTDAQGSEATLRALTAVYEGQCDVAVGEPKHNGRHALHEVVRALADIYGFEMDKLLKKMLDTYLETAIVLDDSTASLLLPSTRYQASLRMPVSWEAQLRRRIVYILRAYSVSELVTLLLRFAYNNHGGISCLCRARALDIVLSLVSEKDIAALQSPGHVKRYFQALLYLADFEFVGIPQSTADFVECSKPALARSIWVDYHEDPKVVQLICNMCLDFGIEDSDLLSRIIPRLLAAKVFRYVTGALEIVGRMPHYSTIPELPMFWNQAVAGSLVQISEDRAPTWVEDSASVLSACIRSLYLPDIDTCNIL
ncbi:hypothetical protein FBU59_001832 [Linderina macrospora]|uniref:Uncharacterized protein n=1 Tax=Linderina macrospora TaxID=4868 RepID=A0ACC1JCW5_9FUNG|nr:hypothetical protein FBU59_001832 [Linderina macrospora]